MENFKITIDVNVNLHDDIVRFFGAFAQLTMRAVQNGTANPVEAKRRKAEAKPEEVKVEDLRTLVKDKAIQGDARQAIKNKLSEMGAERVTALTPEQYADFYEFLKSL